MIFNVLSSSKVIQTFTNLPGDYSTIITSKLAGKPETCRGFQQLEERVNDQSFVYDAETSQSSCT